MVFNLFESSYPRGFSLSHFQTPFVGYVHTTYDCMVIGFTELLMDDLSNFIVVTFLIILCLSQVLYHYYY